MNPVPIRTLIVDDEPLARQCIRTLIADDPDLTIVGECEDGPAAIERLRTGGVDLVFLDIQMPGASGLEVLASMPHDSRPVVVFVTAYDQFLLEAFDVEAVDYLLKPFQDDRFLRAVERAKRRVGEAGDAEVGRRLAALVSRLSERSSTRSDQRLALRTGATTVFVKIADILWIEASDYMARIYAETETHSVRQSLSALAEQLGPGFLRIHRSAIINLARVASVQRDGPGAYLALLDNGVRVKVGRAHRKLLQQRLGIE